MLKSTMAWLAMATFTVATWAQPVEGEVRKVDKAQAKLTLKHGEIKALGMPAMTMVYRVRDPRMLDSLAVGMKVQFEAKMVDGHYTVVELKPR